MTDRGMKLGLNIPNFGPTATPPEMRGWLRVARDGGFALYLVLDTNPDHPPDRRASEHDWRAVTAVAASLLSSD